MDQQEQLTIELNDANKSYHAILNHREYIIKSQNKEFNLRIEIDSQNIYFILTDLIFLILINIAYNININTKC